MRARRRWAVLFVTCWPALSPAAFDPSDFVQFQVSETWVRDNNLFRLSDTAAPAPGSGINPEKVADTTRTLGVGLKFEKLAARQRLIADLNLNDSVYYNNSNLDYLGWGGRLAWLWQLGSDWSGEAGFRKRRSLNTFADFHQNVQDLVDTETRTLAGGYQFHPRWRIAAEFAAEDTVHSATAQQTLNVNSRSAGATLTYRTPVEDSIGLQARRTDRNYPNRVIVGPVSIDNAHRETRLNAIAAWRFSGLLKLDAQIGQVDVRHDNFPSRDFSGGTWRAAATWDATGKFRMSLTGYKDVRLYEDVATDYVVVNSVGVSPSYAVTAKVVVQGDFSSEKRDYRGPGLPPAREDDVKLVRATVRYSPVRNLDLSVSYETSERNSNVPSNSFEYQQWLGTIQASF